MGYSYQSANQYGQSLNPSMYGQQQQQQHAQYGNYPQSYTSGNMSAHQALTGQQAQGGMLQNVVEDTGFDDTVPAPPPREAVPLAVVDDDALEQLRKHASTDRQGSIDYGAGKASESGRSGGGCCVVL